MEIVMFAREFDSECYASVSWGKDSTILADLVSRVAPEVTLVHIRVDTIDNPECQEVRDIFLRGRPTTKYDEVTVRCRIDASGIAHATGTLERGIRQARRRHGRRHIIGIRATESAGREWRRRSYSGDTACAPLIAWSAHDVWAYLVAYDLPVHPVYAMSMGGALDRDRLRVSWIGLQHGTGTGRAEWERMYYPDVVARSEGRPWP